MASSLRGDMGPKYLTKSNIPPSLWNAIKTGFESITFLPENNRVDDMSEAAKTTKKNFRRSPVEEDKKRPVQRVAFENQLGGCTKSCAIESALEIMDFILGARSFELVW